MARPICCRSTRVAENIFENFYKLTELKGGEYIVDIIDANGCKFSESSNSITGEMNSELLIEIEQPEKVIDVDIKTTNVSCFGSSDGIVEVYASGLASFHDVQSCHTFQIDHLMQISF